MKPLIGTLDVYKRQLLDGALSAGADRPHRGMPAEIRKIHFERQTGFESVLVRLHVERFAVDEYLQHRLSPGATLFLNVLLEILTIIFDRTLQRLDGARR